MHNSAIDGDACSYAARTAQQDRNVIPLQDPRVEQRIRLLDILATLCRGAVMPSKPLILLCIAIACELFAYWGLSTVAGRREFDEMAGIIPFAFVPLGFLCALTAALLWWRGRRTRTAKGHEGS